MNSFIRNADAPVDDLFLDSPPNELDEIHDAFDSLEIPDGSILERVQFVMGKWSTQTTHLANCQCHMCVYVRRIGSM